MRKILWSIIAGLIVIIVWIGFAFYGPNRGSSLDSMANFGRMLPQLPNFSFGTLSQPTTLLFMGTDVVYEKDGRQLKADRGALSGRSDTMMLVFLNPPLNKVSVLQIPRDTEAPIPGHGIQKINAANALGGPELAKETVSSLLEVPVDHYVVMNIQGLVELVNELGGITVEIPKKMKYMDWTGKLKIDLEPGWHTLTGNQSMGFVRFRHDDLGDIGRVQRQQIFLNAVCKKMVDPGSWTHVPALVGIAQKSIQTDLPEINILEALNFIHNVPKENIKFVLLPGQFAGNGDWLATYDAKTLAAHLAYPDQETTASRRNISVCIINATSDRSFGSKLAQALRKLGYIVSVGKDDRDAVAPKTRIICQDGNTANAKMLQQDLGNAGELMNASIGSLNSSITVVARDDINLDNIHLSSVDAPYVTPSPKQPLFAPLISRKPNQSPQDVNPADLDLLPNQQTDANGMETNTPSTNQDEAGQSAEETSEPEKQHWREKEGSEGEQFSIENRRGSENDAATDSTSDAAAARTPHVRAESRTSPSGESRSAYGYSESNNESTQTKSSYANSESHYSSPSRSAYSYSESRNSVTEPKSRYREQDSKDLKDSNAKESASSNAEAKSNAMTNAPQAGNEFRQSEIESNEPFGHSQNSN